MQFTLEIVGKPVHFSQLFDVHDQAAAIEFVHQVAGNKAPTVLFISTPPTPCLATVIQTLGPDVDIVVRDDHDVAGQQTSRRLQNIQDAATNIRVMLGPAATITWRTQHTPSCASLVQFGEFAEAQAAVADPKPSALLAVLKAFGIEYPGGVGVLDQDAAILERSGFAQGELSPFGALLAKNYAALPSFTPTDPLAMERAIRAFLEQCIAAVQGDAEARGRLEAKAAIYDAAVAEAKRLAGAAQNVATCVWLVDAMGSQPYDLRTLIAEVETRPPCCRLIVLRTADGPIAEVHGGEQYRVMAPRIVQSEVNVQDFLPSGFVSSRETGILCNSRFNALVNHEVWSSHVLPALTQKPK